MGNASYRYIHLGFHVFHELKRNFFPDTAIQKEKERWKKEKRSPYRQKNPSDDLIRFHFKPCLFNTGLCHTLFECEPTGITIFWISQRGVHTRAPACGVTSGQ
jgi:hypothetical protein